MSSLRCDRAGGDAVVCYPVWQRAFSSNGMDCTISIHRRTATDRYEAREPIATAIDGRTMTIDFVAGRAHVVSGTLRVFVFDPIPRRN